MSDIHRFAKPKQVLIGQLRDVIRATFDAMLITEPPPALMMFGQVAEQIGKPTAIARS